MGHEFAKGFLITLEEIIWEGITLDFKVYKTGDFRKRYHSTYMSKEEKSRLFQRFKGLPTSLFCVWKIHTETANLNPFLLRLMNFKNLAINSVIWKLNPA